MKKMMKSFLLAAAAVAAISCAKELAPEVNETPAPEVELVPMTFNASSEVETKVAHDGNGLVWQDGDKIAVISGTTFSEFTATDIDGSTATFTGWTTEAANHYAVYPASAVKEVTAEGVFDVVIPAVQTAVHGSFDPSALVAVAKADDENNLMFMNIVTMVKFRLSNPENVKSVRFTAVNNNGQEATLASLGTIKAETNITGHSYKSGESKMITLNAPADGFKADTDYYIVFRTNDCRKGFTFYFEYNNGTVKKRSTVNPLFGENKTSGFRNQVRNLKTIDVNLTDLTPYDSYQMGFDLVVAGQTINKATLGTATLVSESTSLDNTGVYFINSGVENVSVPAKIYDKDTYIIGNGSNRADVKLSGTVQWKANTLAFKNVNLVDDYTGDLLKPNAANGSILFESCRLTTDTEKTQLIYSNTTVINMTFINCDVKVAAGSKDIIKMGASGVITNLNLHNNIFYSPEENGAASFKVVNNGSNIENLTLDQNTFANVYPATNYMTPSNVASYIVTNNLFYLDKYDAVYGNPYSNILSCVPTSYVADNNYLYKDINNTRLKIYNGGSYTAYTATKANVVTGEVDLTVPTIVPATTAGATR